MKIILTLVACLAMLGLGACAHHDETASTSATTSTHSYSK
jgi:hypothetical protein